MGDSERRRARESDRFRRAQGAGEEFWGYLDDVEKECFQERTYRHHNEHIMREKKTESERRFRIRRKEEEGKG